MSRRILVIDDHEDNRHILRDLLENARYEVLEATTGEEGVALAEAHVPDLILMDIQLPDIDGYEATRRIKSMPTIRHVPVIAVTSYALSGDDVKALRAVVRIRKQDENKRKEEEAVLVTYLHALGMAAAEAA